MSIIGASARVLAPYSDVGPRCVFSIRLRRSSFSSCSRRSRSSRLILMRRSSSMIRVSSLITSPVFDAHTCIKGVDWAWVKKTSLQNHSSAMRALSLANPLSLGRLRASISRPTMPQATPLSRPRCQHSTVWARVPAITWVKTPEVPFALATPKKVLRRNRQMRPSPSRGRNRARRAS